MDIEEIYEQKDKTNISSKECIHCYRCVELCPEEDALSVAFLEKRIIRSKHPANRWSLTLGKKKSIKPLNPNQPINPPPNSPGGLRP
jgi:formate hydrogenlyase subunit 6/NADH:ubiquinone oxidoreductase subunit I